MKQNNYATKIVNAYIVYDWDAWPKTPLDNFTLKNSLFWVKKYSKNSNKNKWVYFGYGIAVVGKNCEVLMMVLLEMF